LASGLRTGSDDSDAALDVIGGLMVQAHAMAASISAVRPTNDVDVIVRVGTSRPNALTTSPKA